MLVQCFEPGGQPKRAALELTDTNKFALFAVDDLMIAEARGLRATVLRRLDRSPPPQSVLVLEAEVRRKRPGEPPVFRISTIGRKVTIEWVRTDGRSKVTRGNDFRAGSRFEVTLPDMRAVLFALDVAAEVKQGAGASVGGRSGGKDDEKGRSPGLWMVPAIMGVLADPWAQVKGAAMARASKMGLSPALLSPAILSGVLMAGAGVFAYIQYGAANDARAELAAMKTKLEGAEAGRDAALLAEASCVKEREDIAKALDDVHEARKLQAEVAMAVPLAVAMAVEVGGAKMASEEALAYDAIAVGNAHDLVVAEMSRKRPKLADPARCLAQEAALGQDLPKYVLFWHPDAEFLCPEEYKDADGAVERAGPWGLSSRAVAEFGAPMEMSESVKGLGDTPDDARMNHRYSAHAMTVGLRAIATTLLEADTEDRPPVSPGQVNLWALALWDLYNRMPSQAGGVMDKTAPECVAEVLQQVARAQGPAKPGQPVLPDLSLVAQGETITLTPNAGCPFPADGLEVGAKAAVEAVTRMAVYAMESSEASEG